MNMLVDGEWRTDAYETTNEDGEFDRVETDFRNWIDGSIPEAGADPTESAFPAEPDRYHLYICRACPWAHRAAMVRQLRGLEDVISLSLVQPERYDQGWEFSEEFPDPLYDEAYLRDVYTRADPEYTGRVTVPVLWDTETETIVNNESAEIFRMLDTAFDEYANDASLYPPELREEVDYRIDDVYDPINNGVYRAGFAESQAAYDEAVDDLFEALDRYEELLSTQRFVAGDRLTLADLALFATLVRFDHVYHTHFMCNRRFVHQYPHLWNYTKELAQIPAVDATVNMDHIRRHYYRSHGDVNPERIVATGPDVDFHEPHDRDRLAGGLPPSVGDETAAADD
ncbi:MAG: glutathione S-transferase family protein [Halolamina sp.]